jgi:single-strand DNA-binding protein
MASLNKVMLIGNAGKDAELRYLSTGTPKSEFSLAVNNRRRNPAGEWEDQTEWFNIVIFGDQAERVSQYITKGKPLYVEGRLQTRNWDDDQGVKHYRTEIIVNTLQLLGSREGGGAGAARDDWGDGGGAGARPARSGYSGARGAAGETDPDDLPFE